MSFFAPPTEIATRVFTRIPDTYSKLRRSTWADANRGGQAIGSFLEGPSFDRNGNLYVCDIPFGRVFRISPSGGWALIAEYDGWPNGLKIHRDGRIFITDYKRGIVTLDPETGIVTPVLENVGSEAFKGVNDLIFAPNGDLYFTDQGQTGLQDATGRVYRYGVDGRLTCLINTVPSPNGIAFNDDASSLFIAVTRAQAIWRIPLSSSGIVGKVGVFAHLHGGMGGPDGLAMDAEGCLCVAHTGFGSIWRLSPVAEPLHRIRSCAGISTTNLAFAPGSDQKLYITESQTGSVLIADMPAGGLTLYSHQ
ncbi:MAG: SMP-30/gluconolactonase/LRE family protein [Proteobacteria bacterium]|nr:SMP-30/gluconolactonase/LRE family protein [Pseudomonadota bacterium]